MGIYLLVRPVDQQQRQLAVSCYSKCYCTASGVNVLARKLRLASNRYIVCDNANKKVCQYVNHLMKYQEKINVKFCSLLSCRTDKNVFFWGYIYETWPQGDKSYPVYPSCCAECKWVYCAIFDSYLSYTALLFDLRIVALLNRFWFF